MLLLDMLEILFMDNKMKMSYTTQMKSFLPMEVILP